ncbi:MAG TPA: ankyrin repeat domain-containing protein [Mucilaginibacter sp.]|nr:ankyrin repeat domain-containing protein [Mucilaginibacter sp.]
MKASQLFNLISTGDYQPLRAVLAADPNLANAWVPCSDDRPDMKGHPLHRICDVVFAKAITDEQAIEVAKILLAFGANIDGYKSSGDNNTPLIAASSLHAEKLGIFYIEQGADIYYADNDGATALHWAAFCGRDLLVAALIAAGANINQQDTTFNSTPIGWAIHTLTSGDTGNQHHQLACVKLLLKAGADQAIIDSDTRKYLQETAADDNELKSLLA